MGYRVAAQYIERDSRNQIAVWVERGTFSSLAGRRQNRRLLTARGIDSDSKSQVELECQSQHIYRQEGEAKRWIAGLKLFPPKPHARFAELDGTEILNCAQSHTSHHQLQLPLLERAYADLSGFCEMAITAHARFAISLRSHCRQRNSSRAGFCAVSVSSQKSKLGMKILIDAQVDAGLTATLRQSELTSDYNLRPTNSVRSQNERSTDDD